MKKTIFISYSSFDAGKVKTLFDRIGREKLLTAIVVEYDGSPMKYIPTKIIDKLNRSDYFVPIITHSSIRTQYINQEIGYATAKKIRTLPLIENEVIHDLRGFITAQNDLPFSFRIFEGNKKKEREEFRNCCDLLISFILNEIEKSKKPKINLSQIFKGQWQNQYTFPDGRSATERVEIKGGNQYYVNGKHMFSLDNIFISKDKKSIRFRKNGINSGDDRKALNILQYKRAGMYSGDEQGNVVIYSEIK